MKIALSAPLCAALAGALLAAPSAAQTGPFAEGELLVRSVEPTSGALELYRVDPVTGHGEVLATDLYAGYTGADWLAYDSYRDGVLAYTSDLPFWASPRLHLIRANGEKTDLGLLKGVVSGIAPVGDGRVYLRKAGVLQLLSASNQLAPVTDASTGQPVNLSVDHLIYDPGTNALIGAGYPVPGEPCGGFGLFTVHRFSLSADGKQVVGSACAAWSFGDAAAATGLDRMPNGDILLSLADGYVADDNLLRIDPTGPSISLYAEVSSSYTGGVVWSQALGSAVLLDNYANLLRTYAAGSSGVGPVVACDVLFPAGAISGWSTYSRFTDVTFEGPVCPGSATQWGQGTPGYGGYVPLLGAGSCPKIGQTLPLTVGSTLGGAQGLLLLGLHAGALPLFGGTLYVMPPFVLQVPFAAGSTGPGEGFAQIPIPVPSQPSLIGVPLHAQAGVFDTLVPQGVALSNALTLVLG